MGWGGGGGELVRQSKDIETQRKERIRENERVITELGGNKMELNVWDRLHSLIRTVVCVNKIIKYGQTI